MKAPVLQTRLDFNSVMIEVLNLASLRNPISAAMDPGLYCSTRALDMFMISPKLTDMSIGMINAVGSDFENGETLPPSMSVEDEERRLFPALQPPIQLSVCSRVNDVRSKTSYSVEDVPQCAWYEKTY
jgi:hypothetical protein